MVTTRWQALPGRMVARGTAGCLRHATGAARWGCLGTLGSPELAGDSAAVRPPPPLASPPQAPGRSGSAPPQGGPAPRHLATGRARAANDSSVAAGCARFGTTACSASERHASAAVAGANDAPGIDLRGALPAPAPWSTSPIVVTDPCPRAWGLPAASIPQGNRRPVVPPHRLLSALPGGEPYVLPGPPGDPYAAVPPETATGAIDDVREVAEVGSPGLRNDELDATPAPLAATPALLAADQTPGQPE